MINFQKTDLNEKLITGTGKRATLCVDAQTLIRVFGEPTYAQDWDKVKYMWVFKAGDMVLNIYDYKEKRELDKINEWSVGGKNILQVDAIQFINRKFEEAGEEYRELA
jgi:hypothetical protein